MTTSCQICERPIKAANGIIAHHGYKRPRWARYQTQSCFGARFRPYEEASDALPRYVEILEDWWNHADRRLSELQLSPPTAMKYRRDSYNHEALSAWRPDDFDPQAVKPDYRPHSYVTLYLAAILEIRDELKDLRREITRLKARLEAWVAP